MQHWFSYPTNVDPVAIHLGPIKVHWYGIAYLVGFICVYLWMSRPEGRRRLGLTREQIQDFLFYALLGVLIGGRTFFVFNDIISKHDLAQYLANPINFIAVWNGGMAFHGGMVGVLIAIWLFVRKHPGLKYTVFGDEVVVLLPIGITLTRIVNFINDELWGDICNPDRPWCLQFPSAPDPLAYRHPAQIYEAILDILTLADCALRLQATSARRRRGLDVVHDLRHHSQHCRDLAPCGFPPRSDHRRPALCAADDRHRGHRTRVLHAARTSHGCDPAAGRDCGVMAGAFADRLAALRADLESELRTCGRDGQHVAILGVSKKQPAGAIVEAVAAGLQDIGENYVQEATAKFASIDVPVRKHYIGHVQTNKAKAIARLFDVVQTVDRADAAKALGKAASDWGAVLPVLLQLNISPTERFGCPPAEADRLAELVRGTAGLRLDGVMAIGPDYGKSRRNHARIRACRKDVCPRRWKHVLNWDVGRLARGGARRIDDDPHRHRALR